MTFTWTDSGAAQYWLTVGTSVEAYDLYSGDQGTGTSRTVSDLPDDGSTLYVRIWSSVAGDGVTDLTDAIIALQVIIDFNPAQLRTDYAASGTDVNGDNRVGMEELIYILQREAELR